MNMLPRPKLLLLDLDDVLVEYSHAIRCRVLAQASGASEEQVHRAVFASGLEARSDRGEFDLDAYLDLLRSEWGLDIPASEFLSARRQSTRARPGMLALCEALSSQAQLAVFTNNGQWLHQHIDRVLPELSPLFRHRFVTSASLRLSKPDPQAFAACLERLGYASHSTLFVDDKRANVDGAKQAGIDAFVFEDEAQFAGELVGRGFVLGELHAF
ncbi:HAD-IA family hydrolase [Arenimonas sp.]|uniref:HAD-IA family hydrolase n=1 Tax=Arenimonas sp. TaxID=1872635 RepID=UPI0039E21AC7